MQKKALGRSGVQVVPLMLGGNVFGWTADEQTSFDILDAFVGRGFDFIDTADKYTDWIPGHKGGESETVLGNWFKRSGKRGQVVLATKVGMLLGGGKRGLSKRYIMQGAEDSLRRLQTDVIDLYQSHKDDGDTPLEETLEAFKTLIEQGKVKMIGASNYSGARLREVLQLAAREGLPVYQTLQPEYNLYDRKGYEQDLEPVVREFGLGVVPYFSLASGFLTGKYKTAEDVKGASRERLLGKYFDERGLRILEALAKVAAECGATQASVALAWLLAQPTVTAPIASATSTTQLQSLFAAVELKLSEEQVSRLTAAGAY